MEMGHYAESFDESTSDPGTDSEQFEENQSLAELQRLLRKRESDLAVVQARHERKTVQIQKEIDTLLKMHIELASKRPDDALSLDSEDENGGPPGPLSLMWVDGTWFSLFSTLVVVVNLVMMVIHREKFFNMERQTTSRLWRAEQVFLVFYIVELTLKFNLWRDKLLCGRSCRYTWKNWLDFIIITLAVFEQWLLPLFLGTAGMSNLGALRIFRLLRLCRLCRILGNISHANLRWAEGDTFTAFIMGVIGLNCLAMGLQADNPEWGCWIYVENLFLTTFFFELTVRLRYRGCAFFYGYGSFFNCLDFLIVFGGALDLWLIPLATISATMLGYEDVGRSGKLGEVMVILRMLRLIRLLRLVRLVKTIPPLYNLLVGILQAMQGMGWIGLLTLVIIYLLSLLCFKLAGPHGLLLNEDTPPEVRDVFPSIGRGMWWLFMAMNGDPTGMQAILDAYWAAEFLCATYMVFSSFAILSVLTGVVCDKMASVSEELNKQEEYAESNKKDEYNRRTLEELFDYAAADRGGFMSKGEWDQLLSSEDHAAEFLDVIGMSAEDLPKVWEKLSKHEKKNARGHYVDAVSKEDFVDKLLSAHGGVREVSLWHLEKRLAVMERTITRIAKVMKA